MRWSKQRLKAEIVKDKSKGNDATKALTKITRGSIPVTQAGKPEVVWSHPDFGRELEKAKGLGRANMSNHELLSFCHGVNGYYHPRFWVDARPFFRELWHRINAGKLAMTRTSLPEDSLHAAIGERSVSVAPMNGAATAHRRKRQKVETWFPLSTRVQHFRPMKNMSRDPEVYVRQTNTVACGPLGTLARLRGAIRTLR